MTSFTASQLFDAFARGLLSPVLTWAHLIGLLGLALLAARQTLQVQITTVACFAVACVLGLAAIAFAIGATPARNVVLGTAVASGVLAAAALKLPRLPLYAFAVIVGATIGLDSPPETVSLTLGHLMLIGTALGACAALVLLVATATALHRAWPIALRVLGSWIAAIALLALALRLVR
jgi:hypothetical protein